MERRKFIRNLTLGSAAGFTLGGIPMNLLAGNSALKRIASASDNENILVFIQLHGGNDALNTLIPVSQYNDYYNLRPNIAIPDFGTRKYINVDTTVDEADQVGLHPDMLSFKDMYDNGMVSIVQNVGYPDMNLSHFRGRDIVFMGGDSYDDYQSGWMGRFLDNVYPGYPDAYPNPDMLDPLGVELSGTMSLAYHRETGIPIGLNLGSPQQFYDLISSVGVESDTIITPDSHAGDELEYIMEFEKKSNQYAERLKNVFEAGSNSSVVYPETYPYATQGNYSKNPLSPQLELIARMIKGGVKTKIFLCRIGGFDTHGEQTVDYDPTLGIHASLLYHLSSAIKAFFDDMKILGIDHKVMAMTFTEFGRRAYSNASYGTDHGTSTPVMLFGPGLNPGIYGTNPDLNDLANGNIKYNIDYRNIYTSIVQDWFGADNQTLIDTGFNEWVDSRLPLVAGATGVNDLSNGNGIDYRIYPNPVSDQLNVFYKLQRQGTVKFTVLDSSGRVVRNLSQQGYNGDNQQSINISDLPEGLYHLRMVQGNVKTSSQFIKIR